MAAIAFVEGLWWQIVGSNHRLDELPHQCLVGTSPELQLPTIVSRCQVVTFTPLEDDLVADLLRAQGVEDEDLLDRLVRLGHGSPGQARALADPALWAFRRTLLDGLSRPQVESVALAKQWAEFIEEAGKESAAQRRRAARRGGWSAAS